MKIIINLSKKEYDRIQRFKWEGVCMPDDVYYETHCGIPIPDNATNGDVIQALFPNIDKGFSNVIDLNLWWNAKYKAES